MSFAQRGAAIRNISSCRIISTSAVLVLAKESQEALLLEEEYTCIKDEHEIARVKQAIHKMLDTDSPKDDRRDGMVSRPGDGYAV